MEHLELVKTAHDMIPKPYIEWGPRQFRKFVLVLSVLEGLLAMCLFGIVAYGYSSFKFLWNGVGTLGVFCLVFLLILMIVVATTSGFGFFGAYKYRFTMVWIYSIFCMICFVLFLALGLATVVNVPQFFDPSDDSKCTKTDTFTRFQTYAVASNSSICVNCGCYFPNINNAAVYTTSEIERMKNITAPQFSTTNASLGINAQSCKNWNSSSYDLGYLAMEQMETKLKCTGWCKNTYNLYYRFSNVNNGKPINSCYSEASRTVEFYARIGFVVAFTFAALFMLSVMTTVVYVHGRSRNHFIKQIELSNMEQRSSMIQHIPPKNIVQKASMVQPPTATPLVMGQLQQPQYTAYALR